jgi:hypothetical protein
LENEVSSDFDRRPMILNRKKKCVLALFVLSVFLCFTSCVIHKKFPFICFLPECVKQEYHLKGLKKRLQANVRMERNKRERRRMAARRGREASRDHKITGSNRSADTNEYGRTVIYTKYLVVFRSNTYERKDTLLIVHSSSEKHIMEAGRNQIYELVRSLSADSIRSIAFRQVRLDQADQTDDPGVARTRERKIRKYLVHQGVNRRKISFTDGQKKPDP